MARSIYSISTGVVIVLPTRVSAPWSSLAADNPALLGFLITLRQATESRWT